ncbi:sporulation protein YunB [Flavonifractor hominis]|uniref:Sporulation protein YunB n=1 Tax=Flavonifractor hominis TaxID=3133178 RepID=A0ABV1EKJ1_9FIRM
MHRPRYRLWFRPPRRTRKPGRRGGGILLSAVFGIGMALLVIGLLDSALRPTVVALAQSRVENTVTGIINRAVTDTLTAEAISYSELVTLEKNEAGQVTVLTTDSARLNVLRTEILEDILCEVKSLDGQDLGIPLGSLTGLSSASNLGPNIPVRVLTAATPSADFRNVFTSAGINQTLHQIMLEVQVEVTLLIPGGTVETVVEAQVCAAETLLVGSVPETYLELTEQQP